MNERHQIILGLVVIAMIITFVVVAQPEPAEIRLARQASALRSAQAQASIDRAVVAPAWALTKVILMFVAALFFIGLAAASVTYAFKLVLVTYAKDGLYPLFGLTNPNGRIPNTATHDQVMAAAAAIAVQMVAAGGGGSQAIDTMKSVPQLPSRLPEIRVVDDQAQIERVEQILLKEGL